MIVSSHTRNRNTQSHIIGNRAGKYSRFCDHNVGRINVLRGMLFLAGCIFATTMDLLAAGQGRQHGPPPHGELLVPIRDSGEYPK